MNRIRRALVAGARCLRGLPRRVGLLAAVLVTLCAAACAGGSTGSPQGRLTKGGFSTQGGLVTRNGGGSGGGNETSSSFSLAFAKCMRAHGVGDFPNPDGQPGQLGPASGVNPGSQQFQAAINGPCKSLAPPAWVSSGSGPIQNNGGS
jgi:hypothetical protein